MLAFGPSDGFLYAGIGDGGGGGDPRDNAQNPATLLGKMLRLDVSSPNGEAGGEPYAIPADNPGFARPEIWSLGLRNPWRFSFDVCTADLYIADVGQNSLEEIDFEPPGSPGRNYGWNLLEGNQCFPRSEDCEPGQLTPPILDYPRSFGGSITGGYVYRGRAIPSLRGTYLYADYNSGRFGSLRVEGGQAVDVAELTADLNPDGLERITSFGQDNAGEVYVAFRSGEVFRIDAE
jgi:glucose/arabinose dehydrogenase